MRSLALFFALSAAALAGPITEVELTADPPGPRMHIHSARFSPAETRTYDELIFSCSYRQTFRQPDGAGGLTNKVHTPGFPFEYREKQVRMVAGLDRYIAFRVPVNIEELRTQFGKTAFVTNAPATIASVTIRALSGGKEDWKFTLKPGDKLRP